MTITQSRLKEVCTYDPETGIFEGIIDRGRKYKVGDPFGKPEKKGYLQVTIDGRTYHLQRLAWLYVYGVFPENQVDHRNNVPDDNRISNLREADRYQQSWNKSGDQSRNLPKNVHFLKASKKFRVTINKHGSVAFTKEFGTLEEASRVAQQKRNEIHGEFARG